jgi:hypothetical protein
LCHILAPQSGRAAPIAGGKTELGRLTAVADNLQELA